MWRILLIFLFVSIAHDQINATSLKKSISLLHKGEYERAMGKLAKLYLKDSTAAGAQYGLARLYSASSFEYYNLSLANTYIKKCMKHLPLDSSYSKPKKLYNAGVTDDQIRELHYVINTKAFFHAEEINTVNSYNHFINNYTLEKLVTKAESRRNNLAFQLAHEAYNVDSFGSFIRKYPGSDQIDKAQDIYELLLYKDITRDSTVAAFKRYMDLFPNSRYFSEAKEKYEELCFGSVIEKGNIDSYLRFIRKYPESPYVTLAEDSIFIIATRNKTPGQLYDFIRQYPKNKNIDRAWQQLYEQETINDLEEEYADFIESYPGYPYMFQAEGDLEQSKKKYSMFSEGQLFGYFDPLHHDTVMSAVFTEASPFSGGLAMVSIQNCKRACKYGYINKDGAWIVRQIYDYAGDFEDGFAIVGRGDCNTDDCKYGMINKKGEIVIPLEYDELYPFSNGLALVGDDIIGYGYINKKGKTILALQYSNALPFTENKAAVLIDTCWRFIDAKGEIVISGCFKKAGNFSENFASASKDGTNWGYINAFGDWVIDPNYYFASEFIDDQAKVIIREKDRKTGLDILKERWIDKEGNFIEEVN